MSFPSQDRRADEKLGQILRRVGSVRSRLNSLAWQHAIFYSLAIAIGAGAAVFAMAYLLSPVAFLIAGSVLVLLAVIGIASAVSAGWRMRTSAVNAAAIADDRAELKGRLSTIVALKDVETRGPLWSYLVEDTLGHHDEFSASKIERRRVSRAIYPLAGALVLAALAFPISKIRRAPQIVSGSGQDDLTVILDISRGAKGDHAWFLHRVITGTVIIVPGPGAAARRFRESRQEAYNCAGVIPPIARPATGAAGLAGVAFGSC